MKKFDSPEIRGTLDTPINYKVEGGLDNPVVKDALKLIAQNFTEKNKRDVKNQQIADLFEEGFEVKQPFGPKKINSKKLVQAFWSVLTKLKLLDFTMHGLQAQDWEETVVADGFDTVLERCDYYSSFRDKNGVAQNMLLYGDGYRFLGKLKEKGFPFKFQSITPTNIYVNTQCTALRHGNKPATKLAIVFSGTWDQFISYFPQMKDKAGMGRIPRQVSYYKELDQTYVQRIKQDTKITEWCYYFDLDHMAYCMFVGSKCTVVEEEQDEEYPFMFKDDEDEEIPYIPVFQYSCIPSVEGFYNHGIGEMIYDLVLLYQGILNQMGQAIEDNVYGIDLINVPNGEEAKLFEKMQMAYQEKALGRRAFVPIGQSPGSQNSVSVQTIQSIPLVQEATELFDRIDLELKRIGIFLDEAENNPNETATKVLSNIDRSTAFTKQIMEYNSSEVKAELLAVKDAIIKHVKSTNKTPLNITTTLQGPNGPYRADFLTMGLLKKTLVEREWFFRVNDKTGASHSSLLQRAQLTEILPFLQPGTPEYAAVVRKLATMSDVDLPPPPPVQPGQPGQSLGSSRAGATPGGARAGEGQQDEAMLGPENASQGQINFRALGEHA